MEHILMQLVNLVGSSLPEMKTVDEDYGQLEMIDETSRESYPLTFPAVLIDAPETAWSNIRGKDQLGTCTVRVRLIIDCYDDTHYRSGTVDKIKERDDLRKRLHVLLQGRRITEEGELIRTASRFYTGNHGIKVYESTYTVSVSEYISLDEQKVQQPVRIRITPSISK
ncbi:hypothetical protein [uncultured Bacteroides sp.]|jgi:hypothetical protein|uniref:hypothetical protein n=1 Tax=uncultured Bacteroides sp. TaxID=162156 RepID=UPI00205C2218|nr:hypothetical protein [uncultured Bacteroides sp.]DAI68468.1 MAG TPA: hypothetical protein [Caudoviricetes sp.]